MFTLRVLEYAVSMFIIAFVSWQIIVPLLMGKTPFKKKGKK